MNAREKYIQELQQHLSSLPRVDSQDALEFYKEFIEDAGYQNWDEIVQKLGTPEELSQEIIAKTTTTPNQEPLNQQDNKRVRFVLYIILAIALVLVLVPTLLGILSGIIAAIATLVGSGLTVFSFAGSTLTTDVWAGVFYFGIGIILVGVLLIAIFIIAWLGKWFTHGINKLIILFRNQAKGEK